MTTVETACGPIPTTALGATLMHEHVFVLNQELERNVAGLTSEAEMVDRALERLQELHSRGIASLVDLTVFGLGRDIPRLLKVAEKAPVNIVVATGLYTYDALPMWAQLKGPDRMIEAPEPLTELFVSDIREGIAGTGVKAGVLKVATDKPGVTDGVGRVLRAVAHTHLETGTPISTHADAVTRRGLDQQAIFREEGVDLSRVVIGHCGDTTDLNYLQAIADNGSYLGMDRFGLDTLLPFEDRVRTVARMCDLGYADRMVLSHDASCFSHNFDDAYRQKVVPNWRYTHISDEVVPALLKEGVGQDDIDQMLIHNPRRFFEAGEAA